MRHSVKNVFASFNRRSLAAIFGAFVSSSAYAGEIIHYPTPRSSAFWADRIYRAANSNQIPVSNDHIGIFIANFGKTFEARSFDCARLLRQTPRGYADPRVRRAYRDLLVRLDPNQALRIREFVDQLYGRTVARLETSPLRLTRRQPSFANIADLADTANASKTQLPHWSQIFRVSDARVRQTYHVAEAVLRARQIKFWRAFVDSLFAGVEF